MFITVNSLHSVADNLCVFIV